ncbi:undecaprenyl-diphosphate phosphatase [Sediminitomix flava]|uniref:Undecaprenyl-diphosphatase n=1 Tax=Sediminitomix flava TaxID=379075 RepID=A0A315ZBB5_SEDFL|nr:undecaprenyl-diphosphate phosphatase [Sediminitomix flava]PWJ42353.1 undecaprenyl-diphosphatase [Sediminitomix flava]
METLDAIILGIIQGLTEFLPVSSSGHLELGKAILGDSSIPEESLLFTVVVHFATALSTIVVYRKDILHILGGLFQFQWNSETRFSFNIILSMLPAAFVGVMFDKEIESFFGGQITFVGCMLLLTSILLLLADKAKNTGKEVTAASAFMIGVSQAIAIMPGISRSGATISTAVLLGIDRERTARFSFLMVVPLIFGKIAKDMLDIYSGDLVIEHASATPLVVGFIAAFLSGLLACTWMIKLVKKAKLSYFSIYCAVVGIIAISVSLIA